MSLSRTYLTIATKSVERASERIDRAVPSDMEIDPLIAVELYAHSFLYSVREDQEETVRSLGLLETSLSRVPRRKWNRELRILRLAILCGTRDVRGLLRLYLQSKELVPLNPDLWLGDEPDWVRFADVQVEFRKLKSFIDKSDVRIDREAMTSFWKVARERLARAVESPDVPIADIVRLVIFDHSDWVRCLGNSLTRALKDKRQGESLLKSIADYKLVGAMYAGSIGRRTISEDDGLEIVRSLYDDGRLLRFAGLVREWTDINLDGRTLAYDERYSYPQDVFSLAEVFLKWHNALLKIPLLEEPEKPTTRIEDEERPR